MKPKFKDAMCFKCGSYGASVKCAIEGCEFEFHAKCGREKGYLADFRESENFTMMCRLHTRMTFELYNDRQKYPLVPEFKPNDACKICFDSLGPEFDGMEMLYSPCCYFGWYHRSI